MPITQTVTEAAAEIDAACEKIEKAFVGTGYCFPAHGIRCILNEALQQAEFEPPTPPEWQPRPHNPEAE